MRTRYKRPFLFFSGLPRTAILFINRFYHLNDGGSTDLLLSRSALLSFSSNPVIVFVRLFVQRQLSPFRAANCRALLTGRLSEIGL